MRLQSLSRNTAPAWSGVYLSLLILVLFALALTGCAQIPSALNTINTATLSDRQAAHAAALSQAQETLREAAQWQQLTTPAQPIATAVTAAPAPALITSTMLNTAPAGSVLTVPAKTP